MDCVFVNGNCQVCGFTLPSHLDDRTRRNCGAPPESKTQLGDRLESLLKKVGITEEKYRELKLMAGLDPTCNCGPRKRFLNKLPAALALGYARGGVCGAYNSAVLLAKENREYFEKPR